jgi:hypothetical protein
LLYFVQEFAWAPGERRNTTMIMNIAALIPVGQKNAISRENLCIRARMTDREVRKLIELSDVLIVNLGTGYFIPTEGEEHLVRQYRRQELARLKGNDRKIKKIDGWLRKKAESEEDEQFEQIGLEGILDN